VYKYLNKGSELIMSNIVIVESPSKSKTIGKYLGKNYQVISSMGHIRDLATTGKFGLGVNLEDNFKPNYIPIKGKKKVIADLKKAVSKVTKVFLATDPDREGEAISWHLKDALSLADHQYERVTFNEITKDKIIEAFNNTRPIDDNLVKSQEARRILDRIIGFRLSKLMQSKTGGRSAGRVQSVVLKLIVDREREIEAFTSEEYWTITANFPQFTAELEKYKNKKIKINNELEADEIKNKLSHAFKIVSIDKKVKKKQARMPFITSTLQQEASLKLNFGAKKTMSLAQKLYEGIELKDETVGLITYMRTDSTRLSDEFVQDTLAFIKQQYGKEYVGTYRKLKTKSHVQDAHEAIRPTSINRTPDSLKPYLTNEEYKLYHLIYARALASLMKEAQVAHTSVILENNDYLFKATGQEQQFAGYLKVYQDYEDSKDKVLPPLDQYHTSVIVAESIDKNQHFTKPPSRYTEAKLIKEMEELGIGRPSTYAKIIDTIKERSYVSLTDKRFQPTEMGIVTNDKLQAFFHELINVKYTAQMETDLDKIADGNIIWYELLANFYARFEPIVNKAFEEMPKEEPPQAGIDCPLCQKPLVIRKGKYGEFTACSGFPACRYIKEKTKEIICPCPKCDGNMITKQTKKGKTFYGCDNYPKCDYALWYKPTGKKCPTCGELIVEKNNELKCLKCD